MLKISVSIVLYNNDINELNTVINCTINNPLVDTIYLVDNSEQNTLSCLQNINKKKIKYIFLNKNVGFGTAHNVAIRLSQQNNYTYHLILNPDVEFEPFVLTELIKYLDKNENCGLVMPKILYKDGKLQKLCKKIPKFYELFGKRILPQSFREKINNNLELSDFNYDKILNVPYLSGCFMLCRNDALKKVNGFDERYFMYMEDLDLTRSIHKFYKTIFYPNVSVFHGYRSESRINKNLLIALIVSSFKYYNKYGWFFDNEAKKFNIQLFDEIKKQK